MIPMEVPLAVLADAANVSVEGKLNIFGIFNNISAGNFPALHPHMKLVVAFEADMAEADKVKEVEIKLSDSDGNDLLMIRGQFTVPKGVPGKKVRINHDFPLSGIVFPKSWICNQISSSAQALLANFLDTRRKNNLR